LGFFGRVKFFFGGPNGVLFGFSEKLGGKKQKRNHTGLKKKKGIKKTTKHPKGLTLLPKTPQGETP